MSRCDTCDSQDLYELRSPLGRDTQDRLIVHQQCLQGHKWHLAFNDLDDSLGKTDLLICDCAASQTA